MRGGASSQLSAGLFDITSTRKVIDQVTRFKKTRVIPMIQEIKTITTMKFVSKDCLEGLIKKFDRSKKTLVGNQTNHLNEIRFQLINNHTASDMIEILFGLLKEINGEKNLNLILPKINTYIMILERFDQELHKATKHYDQITDPFVA